MKVRENKDQSQKQKTNSNMINLNSDILVITLNMNELNIAIKQAPCKQGVSKLLCNWPDGNCFTL